MSLKWLNKLDRKYGRYAIHNLMRYIVIANVIVYVIDLATNGRASAMLLFSPILILNGQIWRLFTFIFIPPENRPILVFFALYFSYIIGMGLEHEWGSFKFNMYYLVGIIATAVIGFFMTFFIPFGFMTISTGIYLNMSMFLAFATIYPDYEVLLFFVLPVKMKYLAYIDGGLLAFNAVYSLMQGTPVVALMILAGILNYFIFFGKDFISLFKTQKAVKKNKSKFKVINMSDYVRHRCSVCGITEKDDPDMEFRYCSKCTGNKEYCMKHIKDHQHS